MRLRVALVGLLALCLAVPVVADETTGPSAGVPGSGLPSLGVPPAGLSPLGLLGRVMDTSRLHISNAVVFSSGFGSGSASAARSMSFTTLAYDFSGPLQASVTLGNRLFGPPRFEGDRASMSLESLRVKYAPFSNLSIVVDMAGPGSLYYRPYRY